jgi:hypothetical protein
MIKNIFRKAAARTREALVEAIALAISAVTLEDVGDRSPTAATSYGIKINEHRCQLDFSHLAAQETASANGSMNALRLSSGWCARTTRKQSLTFTDCFLVRTRRQSWGGRTAERISPRRWD